MINKVVELDRTFMVKYSAAIFYRVDLTLKFIFRIAHLLNQPMTHTLR